MKPRSVWKPEKEMKTLKIKSSAREELVDITRQVAAELESGNIESGNCTLFVRHTICGITINENADPDVQHDILLFLRDLIPQYYEGFRHFEHNSDAHIKSSLMGSSVTIPFANGKLALGRWQGIFLCEFDGPRERQVTVQVLGS